MSNEVDEVISAIYRSSYVELRSVYSLRSKGLRGKFASITQITRVKTNAVLGAFMDAISQLLALAHTVTASDMLVTLHPGYPGDLTDSCT
jgi:hypothetical protein